jgi:hypothetical protein
MRTRTNHESNVLAFKGSPHAAHGRVQIDEQVGGSMIPKPQHVPLSSSEDFLTGELIAEKLHHTAEWVESKCRRRSPNPIPFHNVGKHRLFLWSEIHAWVMNSPKVIHSPHHRRTKTEVAAALKKKAA